MKNRLNLDFSLTSIEDRTNFVKNYLEVPQFKKLPPTKEELETISNYILWGKENDGKSLVQKKQIQIKTKNSTWTSQSNLSSLDELFESPTFNEFQLSPLYETHYTAEKETFSRSAALKKAPPHLQIELQALFQKIDRLDLLINFYELEKGKRKNPPREVLLSSFSKNEQLSLQEKASHLRPYEYLKLRHELVELRRSQFTLRDLYSAPIVRRTLPVLVREERPALQSEIQVFPLGLKGETNLSKKLFTHLRGLSPDDFSEEELELLSSFYWGKKKEKETLKDESSLFFFDFERLEHFYKILEVFQELQKEEGREEIFFSEKTPLLLERFQEEKKLSSSLEEETRGAALLRSTDSNPLKKDFDEDDYIGELLDTVVFYMRSSSLTDAQREILDLKLRKVSNQIIADYINKEYGKNYTANYISTIYKQKIIKQFCESARRHREIVENIFFPEEFKVCTRCKEKLLRNSEYFIKKARTKDGYASRCKKCDKELLKPKNPRGAAL